jgi:HK97 gp10 family phage protein
VFSVDVRDERLRGKLQLAKQEVYRKVMGELLIGAKEIQSEAREIVPVKDGHLQDSIVTDPVEDGFKVGTNSDYRNYIEFGKPQGTGPNGGPRPYLRPAFENNKNKIVKRVQAIIRRLL